MKILLKAGDCQLIDYDGKNYAVDTFDPSNQGTKLLTTDLDLAVNYFLSLISEKDHVSAN